MKPVVPSERKSDRMIEKSKDTGESIISKVKYQNQTVLQEANVIKNRKRMNNKQYNLYAR